LRHDPRHFQIATLSGLVLLGVFVFAFDMRAWHAAACISSTVITQFIASRMVKQKFDVRSPLITALSLTLLLRTGIMAIASKYLIRIKGKHVFNPANFALVILSMSFAGVWISPGQWGAAPLLAIGLFAAGAIVTGKAKRWDVSVALLVSYAALVFGRALWLGDPLSIPIHQMQSGALLIFAFFMISDPKTTPDSRIGRVVYAALVASVGFIIQFQFYNAAGIILALILTAPLVPLFDRFLPGPRYAWPKFDSKSFQIPNKGVPYDNVQTIRICLMKARKSRLCVMVIERSSPWLMIIRAIRKNLLWLSLYRRSSPKSKSISRRQVCSIIWTPILPRA